MTYLVVSAILLIIGNVISKRGLELTRTNEYRFALWASGERRISVGVVVNIIGGVFLLVGLWDLLF
jgi:hypothetical protein